jgi:ABC-type branched-subunit amino acid transport system substrate-binding protein
MIREDGTVKVLDFGIARRSQGVADAATRREELATMTGRGVIIGTPLYMAPEQLRAERIDGRADQFAWGVVAYELLSGKLPWSTADGGVALVAQILSSEPEPLETLAEIPEPVVSAIARALRKNRNERFASMDALIEALGGSREAFADTVASSRQGPAVPAPLPSSQRLRMSGSSADAFVSAPTEAVMTPPLSRREPERPPASSRAPRRRRAIAAIATVAALAAGAVIALKLRTKDGADHASGAASANAAPPECASNELCAKAHGGAPWICRDDHKCVSLASEDCRIVAEPGDADLDSTVWVGTLFALTGDRAADAKSDVQSTDLARRDFAETLGKTGSVRHIGIVSCDTAVDLHRASHHLADDVHVPAAIVGITQVRDILDVVSKIFAPKDVLTMLPNSTSPLVTSLPSGASGRLVYRSTYDTNQLIAPTVALVESVLEPQLSPRGATRLRVAFLHEKGLATGVFYDRLVTTLHFNGKPVVDNGDDFRDIAYESTEASRARALEELRAFRPSIVLARLASGAVREIVVPLEKTWAPPAPRPTFILSNALGSEVLEYAAGNASRRRRFLGMDSLTATAANAEFVNHFNQTFDAHENRAELPGTSFDGFYALAYAIHALGSAPVTGPSLAKAFTRLAGPGKPFLVGPQSIFDAYRELAAGANIDIEGTSGHLDLDPSTGESTLAVAVLCAAPREAGVADHAVESGLVYDEERHGFAGSLTCP